MEAGELGIRERLVVSRSTHAWITDVESQGKLRNSSSIRLGLWGQAGIKSRSVVGMLLARGLGLLVAKIGLTGQRQRLEVRRHMGESTESMEGMESMVISAVLSELSNCVGNGRKVWPPLARMQLAAGLVGRIRIPAVAHYYYRGMCG